MSEIESFKILEEKVNELIKRCVSLQEENKLLKDTLEKTERDMYSLIEHQDELKNKNKELNEKFLSIANSSIVKNIIHNIDEIINCSEESDIKVTENTNVTDDYIKPNKNSDIEVNKIINEENNAHTSKVSNTPQNQNASSNSYNYGLNVPSEQANPVQNSEIKQEQKIEQKVEQRPSNIEKIIHIDENEDPFSSATDESWDKEIQVEKSKIEPQNRQTETITKLKIEIKKEPAKKEEDAFEFSIDDDEYIFGDEEEGGFAFDEKN